MNEQLTIFEYTDEYKENQRIADIKLKEIAEKIKGCGVDVLSLFNGISCGRVALERAGIKVNRYVSYEIDKNANKVAQSNYPNDEYYGDVTTADFTQYKGFDLVIGGSPCTYWSIAKQGRETTPNGEGGRLFMHFARAVKETECKFFLYENNHSIADEIKAFISDSLGVDFIMINSALVSAQNRERCYWTNIPNVKQPKAKNLILDDVLENDVDERFYKNNPVLNLDLSKQICATIELPTYEMNKRVFNPKFKVHALTSASGGYTIKKVYQNGKVRELTPLEYERLQTLPDNYTATVATTNRYKGIGNGWTVDVIAHIFQPLKRYCK